MNRKQGPLKWKGYWNHGLRPKFKKISPGVNHYCITILPNHVATLCVLKCASWWRGITPLLEFYKILIRLRANIIRCNKQARNSCFVQRAWMSVQENIYPPAFTNEIDSTASVTLMSFFNIRTFKRVMVKSHEIRVQPIPKWRPELLLEAPQNTYK